MDTPDEQAEDERTGELAALAEAARPESELTGPELPPDADFIVTKEHRRFTEFAAAVRRDRYIGLCYSPPGVGKTLSARRYACWHELEPLLKAPSRHFTEGRDRADWHTLLYTPAVSATPRMIEKELTRLGWDFVTIRTPDPLDQRACAEPPATDRATRNPPRQPAARRAGPIIAAQTASPAVGRDAHRQTPAARPRSDCSNTLAARTRSHSAGP